MKRRPHLPCFAAPVLALSIGCASPADLEQARAARAAHERCTELHGAEDERCRPLEEEAKAAERHYQGEPRTPLTCDPALLDCPGGP